MFVRLIWNYGHFSMCDDDDYGDLFITQEPSTSVVSLEDNGEYRTVKDVNYSDISDDDTDGIKKAMR